MLIVLLKKAETVEVSDTTMLLKAMPLVTKKNAGHMSDRRLKQKY